VYYIAQAGSSLQSIEDDGTITTLTLPDGVTIDATKRGRFATLGQRLVFTNAPSINLWIDPLTFEVRPLSTLPPIAPLTSAAGASTGLTGAYRWWYSYLVKDSDGNVLSESPLSAPSISLTLANQDGDLSNIGISPDPYVNARRVYRSVAGGSIPFESFDLDDNEMTTALDALADASLSLLPSDPALGNPPGSGPGDGLELITAWKDYLWAVSTTFNRRDRLIFCEQFQTYAWPAANFVTATPEGEDEYGITGLAARRDELGILKRNRVLKVVGSSPEDFEVIIVAEGMGCIAPESVVIIRDVAYFLGLDGVYTFGPQGVTPISRDKVDPWFLTGIYFNRDQFVNAFGGYNQLTDTYDLHLASVGSSVNNRWVSYDIRRQEWLGPHVTSKFTPNSRALLRSDSGAYRPTIGSSDGYLYQMNQSGSADGGDTAIATDWITKWFHGNAPDIEHRWLQPTVFTAPQAAGTLTVTPRVGDLTASNGATMAVDLTQDRTKLPRPGIGRLLRLQFTHSTIAQGVEVMGFELPFSEVGRR
jgi:hypothetical protein